MGTSLLGDTDNLGDFLMRSLLAACLFGIAFSSSALAQAPAPLRCAVDGTFAPHAFPTLQGGVQGFNIDLFREAAKRMGRELTVDSASFSGLIPAMNAGRYDFLCAPDDRDRRARGEHAVHRGLPLHRLPVRHPPRLRAAHQHSTICAARRSA
jgi:ABC-type amino acid transport substrate-binding protein